MNPPDHRARRLPGGILGAVEALGNRLPDPVALFLLFFAVVAGLSWPLSTVAFDAIDPRSGNPIAVVNLLASKELAGLLAGAVSAFTSFPPLGVVLVAILGIGVAEDSGFVGAAVRAALAIAPRRLLTPAIVLVALLSHTAVDAGVLLIPLAGVIYRAAGRHPLVGICAAFGGWISGFAANFIPSAIDPLLAGLTQAGAQIVDPGYVVNPLCNWFFTSASCVPIVILAWIVTDTIVERRLAGTPIETTEGDGKFDALTARERRALAAAAASIAVGIAALAAWAAPGASALRGTGGSLTAADAPLMKSIVPLIFVLSVVPGIVYGYASGRFASHRDVIAGMSKAMGTMAYYLVLAFFAAQFLAAFGKSNLGVLLAMEGAGGLKALALPAPLMLVGVVLLTNAINLLIASASAKWALLAPVYVPMLMALPVLLIIIMVNALSGRTAA
jgi:aminobenzoyl-glutamate transport protein